jgi:hypothetical protein
MSSDADERPVAEDEATEESGSEMDESGGEMDDGTTEAPTGNVREETTERATEADESRADLAAQVELLAEENRRLRDEYVRARQNAHRRTALGLFAVGALALAGALAVPDSRTVLLALGGTGVFAGILTYFLTPQQFVAAEVGERVYAAFAATGAELVAELGLQDDRVYAPVRTTDEGFADVRLFVPSRSDFLVPNHDRLKSLFVVTGQERERGVSLSPTGGGLYREFESSMVDDLAERPADLADQLADALVEGFELAESATMDADPDGGRVTVEVAGSVYDRVDRFDHPVASLVAVGMAANLDVPVAVEVTTVESGPADYFVTCEWDPDAVEATGEG